MEPETKTKGSLRRTITSRVLIKRRTHHQLTQEQKITTNNKEQEQEKEEDEDEKTRVVAIPDP